MSKRAGLFLFASFFVVAAVSMFFGNIESFDLKIFLELRVARVLLGAAVGAALGVSGVLLQALFSNPLCDPYTLGISSGATLGTIVFYSLGLSFYGVGSISGALTGSLVTTLALASTARSFKIRNENLLLIGVMVSFFGASLVSLWMAFTDANGIQSALGWLLGDLSKARFHLSLFVFASVFLLTAFALRMSKELDLLLLGEDDAKSLGLSFSKSRWIVLVIASLLVSFSVSTAGMIGFVGLVIPHFSRIWVGARHRTLILFSAGIGAVFVMIADLISRQIVRPYELPVGVVTSLVGAPIFVWFLFKRRFRHD